MAPTIIFNTDFPSTSTTTSLSFQKLRPVTLRSRVLSNTEKAYSALKRELLSIVDAVKTFSGQISAAGSVTVYTYHIPLMTWLSGASKAHETSTHDRAVVNWIVWVATYSITVTNVPRQTNLLADAISRLHVWKLPQPSIHELISTNTVGGKSNTNNIINRTDEDTRFVEAVLATRERKVPERFTLDKQATMLLHKTPLQKKQEARQKELERRHKLLVSSSTSTSSSS